MRKNFPCHKQPAGSVYCGYYMCEHRRELGRCTTDLQRVRVYSLLGIVDYIIAYSYCLHLILALIFSWMFYLQDQRETHKGPLHEQQLLYVVDDLCRFILHDVVHIDEYFVHPEHKLSTDSKYRSLRQWDNQQLRAGYSSIS